MACSTTSRAVLGEVHRRERQGRKNNDGTRRQPGALSPLADVDSSEAGILSADRISSSRRPGNGREFVMRIYYDGPDALVTENSCCWRTRPVRAYAIAELRNIRLVQRDVGSPRAILTMATAAAAVLIVAPGWLVLHTTSGRLVLFGAAAVAVTLATLRRRNVRQWELRAAYRRARDGALHDLGDQNLQPGDTGSSARCGELVGRPGPAADGGGMTDHRWEACRDTSRFGESRVPASSFW